MSEGRLQNHYPPTFLTVARISERAGRLRHATAVIDSSGNSESSRAATASETALKASAAE